MGLSASKVIRLFHLFTTLPITQGKKFNSLFWPFRYGDRIGYEKRKRETNDQEGKRGEKKETQRETLEKIGV